MKQNVLIIDTDLENCKQIKYSLLSMEVEVYYTQSVAESIEKMQDKQYSLVIMDVLLSTVEGLEMLSMVKQIHDYQNKPALLSVCWRLNAEQMTC